jgi:putative methionine-R-sulfoxide reductase with GAF domain
MRALSDQYAVAFDALVAKNVGIAAAIEEFRSAAHTMEPIVAKLAATGSEMSQIDAGTAQTNSARTLLYSSITLVAALVGAILLSVALSRQITAPVRSLTNTALEIAGGTLDVQAEVSTADEIGTLAQTFNTMTQRLGEAFEEVRRRAAELATVADVSTATATILESKRLLQEVVDLTKERFNLYHSHIYLLDKKGENLLLTAGAGEPGRVMVAEGRSIPLNREQSLVARAARERKGVTVNDVTQAPDFLPHPLLPDTRSELAVPMIAGGNVIGVFDIQSEQVGRFTDSDVNIQTTLAAQLAVSIQNVRSFEESRKQAEFESLVNVIGQKIQRTTSIEETLQTAIRELGTAIGASRVKANLQPVSSAVSTEATSAG